MQSQMFFNGESTTRKRVNLRGRSPKEMHRDTLMEQLRLKRNHRLQLQRDSKAALKIQLQKCIRARREVRVAHSLVRAQFYGTYGKHCQNVDRNNLRDQLLTTSEASGLPTTILLQTVLLLIDPERPGTSKVIDYLIQRNLLTVLREIILAVKASRKGHSSHGKKSLVEDVLSRIAFRIPQKLVTPGDIGTKWSRCFSSQILTVPFLWQLFPYLKEDFASPRLSQHYIDQMASDVGTEFPGSVYLLGNILEIAALALAHRDCSVEMVVQLAATAATVLEALPPIESWSKEKGESRERSTLDEDEMNHYDEVTVGVLGSNLKKQIDNAIDSCFLQQLNKVLSKGPSVIHASEDEGPNNINLPVVAAACAFLHATFNTLPSEQIVNKLASRTDLVPKLWNFVKWCYQDPNWLTFLPAQFSDLLLVAPLWLFPLAVFCTFYKYKLMMVDHKEFYEQGKPLSLDNVKYLIKILKKETDDHLLYPNPRSRITDDQHLQNFHILGTFLAKAMYEGILVDLPFANFFLSKLKQKYNYLIDLSSFDPELYRHLIFLKNYEGDISELEFYFIIVNNEYGEQREEELVPGGKNLRVTKDNVIEYIYLVCNYRLNFQIRKQSSHFLGGLLELMQKHWINMFTEHELQLLISGPPQSLDVDDLRLHTNYTNGYHSEHHVIKMFWEVLKSFSPENQKKFLKFVTGFSRGPLRGFQYLEPKFGIQRAAGSATEEVLDRLPTSSTCLNLLKLPPYRSKAQLETKLLYAINARAGFDLG
ncbi:hypothetical protein SLEP1_g38438 [Rubroshorea leprosula]|nr:hypothetical protein SLEP1_g38438 [Rubroshorea leprosula]